MALSNNGVSSVQTDTGAGVPIRAESPVRSSAAGFTTCPGQDVRIGGNLQQQCSSKEATTHDFLSLCGNKSDGQVVPTSQVCPGSTPFVTTLDFFQPLEKGGKINSGNPSTRVMATKEAPFSSPRTIENYGSGQETNYGLVKGPLDLSSNVIFQTEGGERIADGVRARLENLAYWPSTQLKFCSAESGLFPKATSHGQLERGQQHACLTKQWQQSGSDPFDVAKKVSRVASEEEEDEDDDSADRGRDRDRRKDGTFQIGDTLQKLDGRGNDNKGSTPRSKHSATEQRRRSKINDRFQMLRHLVPNHDQKRDKASFLLEVIEYIQFLQEKVRKFEAAEHGRQQERLKSMAWDVGQRSTGIRDSIVESSHVDPLVYVKEHIPIVSTVPFDMKQTADANNGFMKSKLNVVAVSSEREIVATELLSSLGHASMHLEKAVQPPQCRFGSFEKKSIITKPSQITQPLIHSAFGRSSGYMLHSFPHNGSEIPASHLSQEEPVPPISNSRVPLYNKVETANISHLYGSDLPSVQSTNNVDSGKQLELNIRRPETGYQIEERATGKSEIVPEFQVSGASSSRQVQNGDAVTSEINSETRNPLNSVSENNVQVQAEEQESLAIHGGVINVSSVYSQGLLDTLTRALQSSGLDLSQASISVQIKLGKQGTIVPTFSQKGAPSPSELSQLSQVPAGQTGALSGLEPPNKKPKVEIDD